MAAESDAIEAPSLKISMLAMAKNAPGSKRPTGRAALDEKSVKGRSAHNDVQLSQVSRCSIIEAGQTGAADLGEAAGRRDAWARCVSLRRVQNGRCLAKRVVGIVVGRELLGRRVLGKHLSSR